MMRICLLLVLIFFYVQGWADPSGGDPSMPTLGQYFTVSSKDPTVSLLSSIFGPVSQVVWDVNSTPKTPLNFMFTEFNNAMLVLCMIILIYGTFFGIINTAHEGEFLGKARNSLWVPIRSVFSVVLLIPNTYGYCVLQIIIMWIVLQGAGAADSVWNVAVDALTLNGMPTLASNPKGLVDTQAATLVNNLFQAAVCTQMYTKEYDESVKQKFVMAPAPTATYVKGSKGQYDQLVYQFQPQGLIGNSCGSFSMYDPEQFSDNETTDHGKYYVLSNISDKMPTILEEVNKDAYQFAQAYDGIEAGGPMPSYDYAPDGILENITTAIIDAEDKYAPPNPNPNQGNNPDQDAKNKIKDLGWIYAGAYYREVSKSAGSFINIFDQGNGVPINSIAKPGSSGAYNNEVANYASQSFVIKNNGVIAIPNINSISIGKFTGGGTWMTDPINIVGDWIVIEFLKLVVGSSNFADSDQGIVPTNEDPIVSLQIFGNKLISIVEFCWTILLALSLVLAAASLCPASNPFVVVFIYLMKIAGLAMAALGLLFVFALTMSVYIPMVPYIIFFFGVVGWVVAVLEAMLSAPLVAMAMADVHHEGGIWGRASLAFMLILGVFIRPVFMIFGLIGGMLISRMAIQLLNDSFNYVMFDTANVNSVSSLTDAQKSDLAHAGIGPFQLITYVFIYLSIVIIIVNKAFSLINTIPDQVLRWIGSSHQFGTFGGEAAGKMEEKAPAGLGKIGGIGEGLGSSGASGAAQAAGEARADKKRRAGEQEKEERMRDIFRGK